MLKMPVWGVFPSPWCEHHAGGFPYLQGSSSVLSHRYSFWIHLATAVLAVGCSKFHGIGSGWIQPRSLPSSPLPLPCRGVHPGRISIGITALGRNGHGRGASSSRHFLKDSLGFGSMEFPVACCRRGKGVSVWTCRIPVGWGKVIVGPNWDILVFPCYLGVGGSCASPSRRYLGGTRSSPTLPQLPITPTTLTLPYFS